MQFEELSSNYSNAQMQELAEAMLSFVGMQKQLHDPEDPAQKGTVVQRIRVTSAILKGPPWYLDVDYLWQICQELEQYESSILDWLKKNPSSRTS